ncbi:energy-coupling factor transport system substrate-specific component [Halanaerobium saccharolyticum]|uniref:Energy-coupling factor transport system substrate-specific component n=1 Tax=Halanaerobium saccharolyticum TaxID=43595 RepID=A0A4R7YTN1_9FIRM|nr:ECF transporter S component [Halanaerobium saccharolyticum]RAK10267.1 energy-coupling factor transport system substrate-specific component [Halanaerobium saccharolyticum]TDW00479.1 energy-coupling factor transport system substrate-specific component [Halanaerobium saccharolyticum]TDX52064.1 energy-coupling factor transport system substrate-specific component [Halanaerobium saccharolyticum]
MQNNQKKNLWSFNFSTMALVLIPVSIGINYVGKLFAQTLRLPLWLDSIGTILAGILAGPWVGAISGGINNAIYGLTISPVSFAYGITSIAIGITAGVMARMGFVKSMKRAVIMGLVIAGISTVVSTPINIIFWGGQTGNIWGDALFGILRSANWPVWLASGLDELAVDLPDKIATTIIAFIIYQGLPKRITVLFEES